MLRRLMKHSLIPRRALGPVIITYTAPLVSITIIFFWKSAEMFPKYEFKEIFEQKDLFSS